MKNKITKKEITTSYLIKLIELAEDLEKELENVRNNNIITGKSASKWNHLLGYIQSLKETIL